MFSYFTVKAVTDGRNWCGKVMLSHEEIFSNTEPQEKWLKKNVVFPTMTTDGAT
jgi:hypothetical protein